MMRRIELKPCEPFQSSFIDRTGAFNAQALQAATSIVEDVRERDHSSDSMGWATVTVLSLGISAASFLPEAIPLMLPRAALRLPIFSVWMVTWSV